MLTAPSPLLHAVFPGPGLTVAAPLSTNGFKGHPEGRISVGQKGKVAGDSTPEGFLGQVVSRATLRWPEPNLRAQHTSGRRDSVASLCAGQGDRFWQTRSNRKDRPPEWGLVSKVRYFGGNTSHLEESEGTDGR